METTDEVQVGDLLASLSKPRTEPVQPEGIPAINRFSELLSHDHSITLSDGRKLVFTDLGDPEGTPILFAHGMPGCRLEGWFFHEQARRHGYRLLTPDRPGIGASTYQKKRELLDYPEDVAQLADALGIDRFIHMGWSSGGSRTLACAYALPERVTLAISLSGYTHFAEYRGTHPLIESTRWPGPKLAETSLVLLRAVVMVVAWLARRHPGLYFREARQMISDQDRELLQSVMHTQLFQADQITCLESGGRAIAQDLQTELLDWGFHLRDVKVPTWVYQGSEDPFVPVDYARHLAENLSDVDFRLMPEAGHLYPLSKDFQEKLFLRLRAHT